MTAHTHPRSISRPSICTTAQEPLIGSPRDRMLVNDLFDAYWHDCVPCIDQAVGKIAAFASALLTLRRVCTLQASGKIRWAHGSAEADAQTALIERFPPDIHCQLAATAGRMWTKRARLFEEIEKLDVNT